jgi:LysR family transcriptional regulator, low CO2-responsive transcriptional regulator
MISIGKSDMSYTQLKAFHAVATCGGFSKAAAQLSLTQPALSDHVRKLEETHGVQLFLRSARGVALTDTGRKLYTITERLFDVQRQADELLSRAAKLEEGQITIGADAAVHILPQMNRFITKFPHIAMRLISGNSAELIEQLKSFAIDFAVTAERPASDAIGAVKLRQDKLVVVASKGHDHFKSRSISLAALTHLPLVLREQGSMTRKLLLEEMERRGLQPRTIIEIEGREAVCETVAQGLGVAVMSAGEITADPRLHIVRFNDWSAEMDEWLLYLKARAELHFIKNFLALCEGPRA